VIWAYWGQVDAMQHRYGARSDEMKAEVRNVGFSLQQELLKSMYDRK
jgi:predicted AlkP superfamily pyrophosphatase or phosphodiesterase